MARITKAGFARAKAALGIKKVTKKNIGRIMKKFHSMKKGGSRSKKLTKTSKKTTRKKTKSGGNRRMGRRKFTLPMAPIIGLTVGLAPAIQPLMDGDIEGAVNILKFNYLGITHDNKFKVDGLMQGLFPLIIGGLVHKFVGGAPLNINRMLASAGVPVVRI